MGVVRGAAGEPGGSRAHLPIADLSSSTAGLCSAPLLSGIDRCGMYAAHRPSAYGEHGLAQPCTPSLEGISVRTMKRPQLRHCLEEGPSLSTSHGERQVNGPQSPKRVAPQVLEMIGRGDWIRTSDLMLPNLKRRVLGDHTIPRKTRGILNPNNHLAASSCSGFVSSNHAISDLVVNIWSTRRQLGELGAPSVGPRRVPRLELANGNETLAQYGSVRELDS